jgi:hypothetical protein
MPAIVDEQFANATSAKHREVARIIRRAVAEKKEDRYATVGEFRDEILAALDGCPPFPAAAPVRS